MNSMRFRVYLTPTEPVTGTDDHDMMILPADRMRAERSSTQLLPPSQRGPGAVKTHAETWVLLWLYCAAQRLQLTGGAGFDDWANRVQDYDRLDADGNVVAAKTPEDQVAEPTVDPTQTAASTS